MKANDAIVRALLARRAGCHAAAVQPWQDLEQDLQLTPLGRVMVALDVEERGGAQVPIEQVAAARTVGHLLALLRGPRARPSGRRS